MLAPTATKCSATRYNANLVPTDANLLADYRDWAALEAACSAFCDEVNAHLPSSTSRHGSSATE